jgi:hypothetical protein
MVSIGGKHAWLIFTTMPVLCQMIFFGGKSQGARHLVMKVQ